MRIHNINIITQEPLKSKVDVRVYTLKNDIAVQSIVKHLEALEMEGLAMEVQRETDKG
jgi:hypothetical protein